MGVFVILGICLIIIGALCFWGAGSFYADVDHSGMAVVLMGALLSTSIGIILLCAGIDLGSRGYPNEQRLLTENSVYELLATNTDGDKKNSRF